MASLYIFCTREELTDWLHIMCKKWNLGCLIFDAFNHPGAWEPDSTKIEVRSDAFRLFALPSSAAPKKPLIFNEVKPRDWGWVDIRPGGLREGNSSRILLLSEIHGEDFAGEEIHPARFVLWLKRYLKKNSLISEGVTGTNVVAGGSANYRHIAFSRMALDLLKSGVTWKQDIGDRIVIAPIKESNA